MTVTPQQLSTAARMHAELARNHRAVWGTANERARFHSDHATRLSRAARAARTNDDRPNRPAEGWEVAAAHEENDRREIIATLSAAGFRQAETDQFMIAVRTGFAVRTDRSRTERTGTHYLTVDLLRSERTQGPAALYERMCKEWTAALLVRGIWDVDYDKDRPEYGLTVTRR